MTKNIDICIPFENERASAVETEKGKRGEGG
jgi:hypothetical protein